MAGRQEETAAGRATRIAALDFDYEAREKEIVESCNLCGSREHVQVSSHDRYGFRAPLRMCVRCGLGFLSPRMTQQEYATFYSGIYRPLVGAYQGTHIDAWTLRASQREYAEKIVRFLEPVLPRRPATLLDLGGSTGVVAETLAQAFGAEPTVVDPSPDELAIAQAKGIETYPGFVEDFDPGRRRWDLVLLCQTIDHVLDVAATVAALRRLVAEGGLVFVDVIDLMRVARRSASVQAAVKIDHPYYLTYETAQAFFRQAGLEPVAERPKHWRFALVPARPREPDWEQLQAAAAANLQELLALARTDGG